MPNDGDAPDDLLRERADESRLKLWMLLEADRLVVTALLSLSVFLALVVTGTFLFGGGAALMSGDPVETLFQALLTATITGVTLVLTLNQLVLSQELGAVDDQRERMEGAMAFRRDVADAIDAPVSPARPAQFLRALVQVSGERARDLRDAVDDDHPAAEAVDSLTESLIGNADRVSSGLDDARFGDFDVISSALNFNYSWKVFTARRLRERHAEDLSAEATDALEELTETVRLFGPAREHFKTLYFQWDLINLSGRILTFAVPALLVSVSMIAFFDVTSFTGSAVGVDTGVLLVSLAATVALAPFVVLLAYVMRIATVAKHTLSIGPFILRETDDVAEVEWNR